MLGIARDAAERHLVGAPRVDDLHPVHDPGPGPALRRAQHDHRPARLPVDPLCSGLVLNGLDLVDGRFEGLGETVVHPRQIVAGDLDHLIPMTFQKTAQILGLLARQDCRTGDLVAVEMQHGQNRAVVDRVEEADALPGPLQRTGLGLPITDHGQADQVGVVEGGAECVREHITEFATFVDRAGSGHTDMAGDAAGRTETPAERAHPVAILGSVRIGLRPRPFKERCGRDRGSAVAGAGEVHHVEVTFPDQSGHVCVDESQTR